jgi:hypothetical protein
LSQGRSSGWSRGISSNPNVVHGVSRDQVIGRGQVVANHGGAFDMSHDVTAEDINEDTTIQEHADEEGNRSDIAIWTD